MFQHTAARRRLGTHKFKGTNGAIVSTHSRPKAAGWRSAPYFLPNRRFQHTAARRRLACGIAAAVDFMGFQHTAARRRLLIQGFYKTFKNRGFNTQPPEGGWFYSRGVPSIHLRFQHTAARRRLRRIFQMRRIWLCFNTQPPEGG